VTVVDARPLRVGESMMSELLRLELTYDRAPAPGQPGSIVVKLSCSDAFRRGIADRLHFYRREIDFNRHLAGAVRLARRAAMRPSSTSSRTSSRCCSRTCRRTAASRKRTAAVSARPTGSHRPPQPDRRR